jgi:cell division septation protein DedD
LTTQTRDDAFREIQLNGKQLFFLFMAVTVVSVVIFLLGVLVGRQVRAERIRMAENEALTTSPSADAPPTGVVVPPTAAEASSTDLTRVPPPPPAAEDEIREEVKPTPTPAAPPAAPAAAAATATIGRPAASTSGSAESKAPAAPKPAAPPPAAAATNAASNAAAPASKPAAAPVAASAGSSAPAGGWAVQVAALNTRADAASVAKGYATKGYDAYVVDPQTGTSIYRVRIGSFKSKPEADALAEKLRKQGEKPWVTR